MTQSRKVQNKTSPGHYPGHKKARMFEFFKLLKQTNSNVDKVNLLREFSSSSYPMQEAMHIFTYLVTDPNVEFDLPLGAPSFKTNNNIPENCQSLHMLLKKVSYFIVGQQRRIANEYKREMIFLRWLETCHEGDARLLIAIKDRDLKSIGITFELLQEAFPAWTPKEKTERPMKVEKIVNKRSKEEILAAQEKLMKELEESINANNEATQVDVNGIEEVDPDSIDLDNGTAKPVKKVVTPEEPKPPVAKKTRTRRKKKDTESIPNE